MTPETELHARLHEQVHAAAISFFVYHAATDHNHFKHVIHISEPELDHKVNTRLHKGSSREKQGYK